MSSVNVAAANRLLDHPRTVDLRKADLLPRLDGWRTGLFDPANLDAPPPSRTPAAPPSRCVRSSGCWLTAGASSPATERRWTPGL
jgi:hypothetical protein